MKFTETSPNLTRNTKILTPKTIEYHNFSKHVRNLSDLDKNIIKNEILDFYYDKGWGLKLLARNVLGITYTQCRALFNLFELSFNKGRDICNNFLKEFRREKALHECKENIGFNNPELERFAKSTTRGVQGYYYNKSTESYVWLRSTYEYIYAKFLNSFGTNWKTEQKYYRLSDGTKYSPDFYLYDENWNLTHIVEIKGYWDNRAYKCGLLKEEFFNESSVEVVMIRDIKIYIENNLSYGKELETWKILKKSKEFVSQK